MNKFFKSSILMAFVTAISTSTLITSCQNDNIDEYTQNQEDKVLVNFCLNASDLIDDSKATRAAGGASDDALDSLVSDVWIMQYVGQGEQDIPDLCTYKDLSKVEPKIDPKTGKRYYNLQMWVKPYKNLGGDTDETPVRFYCFANTHDENYFQSNTIKWGNRPKESQAKSVIIYLPKATTTVPGAYVQDSLYTEKGIPMVCFKKLKELQADDTIKIDLKRTVSKVTLNLRVSNKVKVLTAQMKNVNKRCYFDEGDAVLQIGDKTDLSELGWESAETVSQEAGYTTKRFVWYIPDNLGLSAKGKANYINVVASSEDKIMNVRYYIHDAEAAKDNYHVEKNRRYTFNSTIENMGVVGTTTYGKLNNNSNDQNVVITTERLGAVRNPSHPANCYIINPTSGTGLNYYFPITQLNRYGLQFKGDSIIKHDTQWKAQILWQSTDSLITISGYNTKGEGNIIVKTNNKKSASNITGNAIVAVLDMKDNVLWTWHIWVTPTPGNTTVRDVTFMNCNLGARLTDPSIEDINILSLQYSNINGLYYPWGCKDPVYTYNPKTANNDKTAAIDYPSGYIDVSTSWTGSYPSGGSDVDNKSWYDNGKTVFDPCPYGYRVPTFEEISALETATSGTSNGLYEKITDFNYFYHLFGSACLFPMSGYRLPAGNKMDDNKYGYYWSANAMSANRAYYWKTADGYTTVNNDMSRNNLMQIHPVKE